VTLDSSEVGKTDKHEAFPFFNPTDSILTAFGGGVRCGCGVIFAISDGTVRVQRANGKYYSTTIPTMKAARRCHRAHWIAERFTEPPKDAA
jgi:hypothetical protein